MLEIKTITATSTSYFDQKVNEAIAEGWDLVRRECFITGSDRAITLYAEFERVIEEPEEDDDHSTECAEWLLTRNPREPYRCSACGCNTTSPWSTCPECDRIMH